MDSTVEKLENYQKNLRSLQEVTEELLNHMKGYDFSFQPEITDKGGNFSQEKLQTLVDEMTSLWADELRKGKFIDPKTQKSDAEPYIEERRELYRLYLSLVMRCSLYQGAYSNARNGAEKKERTDFAFLLEQAKQLSRSWCVTIGLEGRKNELMSGYDEHFGFHLYHPFYLYQTFLGKGLEYKYEDFALTPDWNTVWQRLDQLTDEGNMKWIYLRHLSSTPRLRLQEPEETPDSHDETDSEEELPSEDSYDEADLEEDVDDALFGYDESRDLWDEYRDADYWAAEAERLVGEENRKYQLLSLVQGFEGLDEYLSDCRAFVKLFEQAKPEVPRDFYQELEEIVELYLAQREAAPLADIDKTLDVYGRLYDGALRQAKRYARGPKWKNL